MNNEMDAEQAEQRQQQMQGQTEQNYDRLTQHYNQFRGRYEKQQQVDEQIGEEETEVNYKFPPAEELNGMSNHEFSGVSGWIDLEDQDCQLRYKNEYEVEP